MTALPLLVSLAAFVVFIVALDTRCDQVKAQVKELHDGLVFFLPMVRRISWPGPG